MMRNRRLTGWWLGLFVAVFVLAAFSPLRGETAPVVPGSGEMKLLVEAVYFTARDEGYIKLWSTMKVLALDMDVPVTEAKNPFKEGTRKIVYLDTSKGDLSKKMYIIRERTKMKDGQADGKVEVTLRYRSGGTSMFLAEEIRFNSYAGVNFLMSFSLRMDFMRDCTSSSS